MEGDNMAIGFNKNRDTMEVFNDRWSANHNSKQINEGKQRANNFNNKMFGTDNMLRNRNQVVTPEEKVSKLNQQISYNNNINKTSKVNSVMDRFRK